MKNREKNREDIAGVRNNIPGLDPRRIWFLACFEISRSSMRKYCCGSGPQVICLFFVTINTAVCCFTFGNIWKTETPRAPMAYPCSEKSGDSLPPIHGDRSHSAAPAGSAGDRGILPVDFQSSWNRIYP